jgi:hypothetical protein
LRKANAGFRPQVNGWGHGYTFLERSPVVTEVVAHRDKAIEYFKHAILVRVYDILEHDFATKRR